MALSAAKQLNTNFLSRVDNPVKSEWVTETSEPDPKLPKIVHGWNLLIRPIDPEEEYKTKAGNKGIIIPSSVISDVNSINNVGQVKAMGPMCYHDPNVKPGEPRFPYGRYVAPWCKVGDYVVWGKHQGVKVTIKGVTYVILQDELILFTLDAPSDISVIHNALKS